MRKGRFGDFGGQYVPETLMNELIRLEEAYEYYKKDPAFTEELKDLLNNYAGRPSLLYYAEKMTRDLGGAKVFLKREDLNHTGSQPRPEPASTVWQQPLPLRCWAWSVKSSWVPSTANARS